MGPPAELRVEIVGGDAFGRGDRPSLSWWLPPGSSVQHGYRIRTDDGFDTGRVESTSQSFVELPGFDVARRSTRARVCVWTDAGASDWSDPVPIGSGLVAESDWTARWIGVDEPVKAEKGRRPAYWLRSRVEVPAGRIRVNTVALGVIRTTMYPDDAHDTLDALHPLGRMGEVSDVVDAITYLESAPFVTGEILHVDGGQSAGS